MDFKKFKKEVYRLKNYKEVFSDFRRRESNCYNYYQKERELAELQYDEDLDGTKEQFIIEWEYVA